MSLLLNYVTFFILVALGAVALVVQILALTDAVKTPAADFQRVYKRTKPFWAGLTAGATFFGFLYLIGPVLSLATPSFLVMPSMSTGLILNLAGATVAGIYLADVRPALAEVRGQKNRGSNW